MTVFQAFLVGLIYYFGNSTWFAGVGYYTIYRPIVSGLLVGIVLGDPVTGTIIGATINLMYIGFISAGGSLPGDMCLAGVLGTALAIASGLEPEAALALAVPIGLLGTLIWFLRMTVDSVFVHWADKFAEEGRTKMMGFMNVAAPQIFLFVISFIPVFLASLYGPSSVAAVIAFLGQNVLHILIVIGGMMPALGIAMNLRAIYKGDNRVFLFVGFLLTVYFNLSIVAVGLLAICCALVIMSIKKGGELVENE